MKCHAFWRDDGLPFVEARAVLDGRGACYPRHAHETFSIGAILDGRCTYLNGTRREQIGARSVVLMNPGDVHACNPVRNEPWAYRMFYLDTAWVARIQEELGGRGDGFQPFAATASDSIALYGALNRLYEVLADRQADQLLKHETAVNFMIDVQRTLGTAVPVPIRTNARLARAAQFIRDNCTRPLRLSDIALSADLSPSYLVRAFRAQYGMSPHAYLVNCRVEFSRAQIRRGRPFAEVALAAGFCDQAHMQRSFKKFVAVTPGQYRG